ncbi:3-hydroxyisobutyrate dehydrogenase, mitochondrial [Nematostella vectensis]|uniref:3-hydroxyisobutyrate dehydrogenase, mitochondrial n=1 Tax=Nematostella vectensis TaxID=45351 RepID=UPI0020771F45|nr:3-hydroxyisobutyrate dehydrogenase, mitochondrial [Nematostella vectensis]
MAALMRGSRVLFLNLSQRILVARYLSNGDGSSNPIGFIGLGNMGSPMAKNLLDQGYGVVVHDIFPESVDDLRQLGAGVAETPDEVAMKTNKIVTMLPSSPNVIEVYKGIKGLFNSVQDGTLLIDCSTIDPALSKEISEMASEKGATYLDAPVSGGITAAKAGTLTFMVGGKEEGFEQAKDVLMSMGKNVIHTGPNGTGQAAKICNNMLLAVSMIGTAEAMNLGIRLGLDAEMIAKIINSSSGRCWSSEVYNPVPGVLEDVPSSNNYQGGFMTALMTKDLGLAQNASSSTMTATPMGSLAHQIYRIMCIKGYANMDFGSVFKFLRDEK